MNATSSRRIGYQLSAEKALTNLPLSEKILSPRSARSRFQKIALSLHSFQAYLFSSIGFRIWIYLQHNSEGPPVSSYRKFLLNSSGLCSTRLYPAGQVPKYQSLMESSWKRLSSQPCRDPKLFCSDCKRHGTRCGLLTWTPLSKTKQKRNNEQQTSQSSLRNKFVATKVTKVTQCDTPISADQNLSSTAIQSQEGIIARLVAKSESLSTALKNYMICVKSL